MRGFWGKVFGGVVAALITLALVSTGTSMARQASWQQAPVVPAFTPKDRVKLKVRVEQGRRLGLRNRVFAKVGDSNTEFSPNLYGMACRRSKGLSPQLRRTLAAWNRIRVPNTQTQALPGCRPWTSFSRRSVAAQAGVFSSWSLNRIDSLPDVGYLRKPVGCALDVTPLDCEVDAVRPRYALVMLGTNDLGMDIAFGLDPGSQIEKRLGGVLRALLARRVVPVLSTIPHVSLTDPTSQPIVDAGVERSNAGIWRLARKFQLPMVNLWRAFRSPSVINSGLSVDGLHLRVKGNGGAMVGVNPDSGTLLDSVDFRPAALRFGANRRNLIWLKTLARLDRTTG